MYSVSPKGTKAGPEWLEKSLAFLNYSIVRESLWGSFEGVPLKIKLNVGFCSNQDSRSSGLSRYTFIACRYSPQPFSNTDSSQWTLCHQCFHLPGFKICFTCKPWHQGVSPATPPSFPPRLEVKDSSRFKDLVSFSFPPYFPFGNLDFLLSKKKFFSFFKKI